MNGLGELIVVLLSDSSERVEGWYFTPLPCLAGSEYVGFTGGVHYSNEILQVAFSHSAPKELIKEIQKLSVRKRIYVIERSLHLLRKQEDVAQMKRAADDLSEDYPSDKELTAFTNLDFENFYETR